MYHHLSSVFLEAEGMSKISETLPAEDEVILSDESDIACASSALSAVLSELSSVGPPELVWHVVKLILIFYKKQLKNNTSQDLSLSQY